MVRQLVKCDFCHKTGYSAQPVAIYTVNTKRNTNACTECQTGLFQELNRHKNTEARYMQPGIRQFVDTAGLYRRMHNKIDREFKRRLLLVKRKRELDSYIKM